MLLPSLMIKYRIWIWSGLYFLHNILKVTYNNYLSNIANCILFSSSCIFHHLSLLAACFIHFLIIQHNLYHIYCLYIITVSHCPVLFNEHIFQLFLSPPNLCCVLYDVYFDLLLSNEGVIIFSSHLHLAL